jgi:hypothetical protein
MAEIVVGQWNRYRHLILAVDVFLSSWIVLECLLFHGSFFMSHFFVFILVELSKFFVCGDDVAEWVSILPQFVKVYLPIWQSVKDDEALLLWGIKLHPCWAILVLV